jgi:hypothetical protein
MSLRLAEGKRLQWIDTRRESGFSNFLFVDQEYAAHPVMRRIFSLARKHGFRSVLIEELDAANCTTIAEEDAALAKRQPDFTDSRVHRLSFLRSLPDQPPGAGDFIGSAIFKSDSFSGLAQPRQHIYEALLPPPRGAAENNFIHCARTHQFHTSVGDFSAPGVLYAQQNDLTFVCAHVALRAALASLLPAGDISYAEINRLAGVDHQAVQVGNGGRGLEPGQMEAVLNGLGVAYEKIVHEPHQNLHLPTDYQRHLYGCIESGTPALLGFELDDPAAAPGAAGRHIIPVLGHTFNEDAWVPEAQRSYFAGGLSYYPSESWLSAFVAHDDNFGPYYCLPRNFLRKDNFRLILALKRFPTLFSSLEAETLAFGYAQILSTVFDKTGQDWLDRFCIFTRLGSLVTRAQCLTRDDYLAHLTALEDWQGRRLEDALRASFGQALPDFFWMAELSAPELFTATRHKFGELLISADRPSAADLTLLLAARLPGHALLRTNGNLALQPTQLAGHTQLFTRT